MNTLIHLRQRMNVHFFALRLVINMLLHGLDDLLLKHSENTCCEELFHSNSGFFSPLLQVICAKIVCENSNRTLVWTKTTRLRPFGEGGLSEVLNELQRCPFIVQT